MYKIRNNTAQVFQLVSGKVLKAFATIYVKKLDEQLSKMAEMQIISISE
jgi:hypothetical protein